MRKFLFAILAAVCIILCSAALADTVYSLSPAPAQITLRDGRTVVTAENLGQHPELLTVIAKSKDDTIADWQSRGVVLQAWSPIKQKYTCLEITVTQDADSEQYVDLMNNPGDKAGWKAYMNSYKNSEYWASQGYTFQSYEQKHAGSSYYLLMKYKRSFASGDYRGYMARTVYQGYTVVFDLKVYNQTPVADNANELYRIIKTFTAAAADPEAGQAAGPAASAAEGTPSGEADGEPAAQAPGAVTIDISQGPPAETNTNTFTVEGTTEPGSHIIGVLMRLGSSVPLRFETDAHAKNGSFKLKVTIPPAEENVWLMTLNVLVNDELVAEKTFDTTTYKKTLIPLVLDAEVPSEIYSDELVISGTTMKAVDVQCIVTDSSGAVIKNGDKKSHPNGTGRFTFKFSLPDEDEYSVALVITKKGYDTKRFQYTVSRFLTEEARQALIRKQALRIGYTALTARIDQYVGKVMTFNVWITAIEEVGDEWRITAAGAKNGDHYSQLMIFIAEQEPSFAVEEKHALFGTCGQPYQIQSEETVETIPSFDLLFWD